MNKSIDVIVLGATGFTGKCTVKYLARLIEEKYWDVTWGIAGRSKEKLHKLVKELNKTGYRDIIIVESDIEDEESLKNMLKMTKVVINSTGSSAILSPPIVKACIETGTHYVDISVEPLHILNLYRNYHKMAEDADVLIIPSCGFSSMSMEAAIIYLNRQFKGTLHTVECYTEMLVPICLPGRAMLHNGTWTSTVYVLGNFKKHMALKREIFPEPVEPEPEEMERSCFFRNNGRLWFPCPGPESVVAEMSQRYLHEKTQKKPLHLKAYTTVQTFLCFLVVTLSYLYYCLCYFKCCRQLLINYPRLFTFGLTSQKGPTDSMRQRTKYSFTLNGKGWELDGDLNSKPNKTLSVKVSGQDPYYDTTAVAVIMCAITILKESSNMPKGGVITPGAAFFRTDIVDRLMHEGYTFEVLKNGSFNFLYGRDKNELI